MIIDPKQIAKNIKVATQKDILLNKSKIKLCGILKKEETSSLTYSKVIKTACDSIEIEYEEIFVDEAEVFHVIDSLNKEPSVTGIIVYHPFSNPNLDKKIREQVSPYKDVEGLHPFWLEKLMKNQRTFKFSDKIVKCLLPCTPLAIIKILESLDNIKEGEDCFSLEGKIISIFNRSPIVGKPLAYMLANDGANVFSFNIRGAYKFSSKVKDKMIQISRKEAIEQSDIIITGVPDPNFKKITLDEIKEKAICLNFSSIPNFNENIHEKAKYFIPRIGSVTVSICLRNLLSIATNFYGTK